MRNLKRDLKIDLIIQGILLLLPFGSLILAIFDRSALFFCLIGETFLGVYQVASTICFALWLKDKWRAYYLIACLAFGLLTYLGFSKGLTDNNLGFIINLLLIPLLMASYYFWYSWKFYTNDKAAMHS